MRQDGDESRVESRAAQGGQQVHKREDRETSRQRREHTKEERNAHDEIDTKSEWMLMPSLKGGSFKSSECPYSVVENRCKKRAVL